MHINYPLSGVTSKASELRLHISGVTMCVTKFLTLSNAPHYDSVKNCVVLELKVGHLSRQSQSKVVSEAERIDVVYKATWSCVQSNISKPCSVPKLLLHETKLIRM